MIKVGRVRLAVQAGIAGIGDGDSSAWGLEAAGIATICLDDDCASHVDGQITTGYANQSDSTLPLGFSGGLVVRVARKVRLIFEADTGHAFGGDLSGQADGFLGWYGVRFTSRNIGVDLTLVKPICGGDSCDSSAFPLGFPFVTFTYRTL